MLASLKFITPIVAAILHVFGSLIVVFNSARLVRQGEEFDPHDTTAPDASAPSVSTPAPAPALGHKPVTA